MGVFMLNMKYDFKNMIFLFNPIMESVYYGR